MARKLEVKNVLVALRQDLSQIEQDIEMDTRQIQELNSIIHQVKESEAFMTIEHERMLRKKNLAEEKVEKGKIEDEIQHLEAEEKKLVRLQLKQEQDRGILEEEEAIYAELGKMKDKYEERNRLQEQLLEVKEQLKLQKLKLKN